MEIGIHNSDNKGFPNIALLKLSAWHKLQGDNVSTYIPIFDGTYDKVYSSKVFSFTEEFKFPRNLSVVKGGTGYNDVETVLDDKIEHICPDYSGLDYSIGFLTRGCPNKCSWCIVPKKEGNIRANSFIEEFLRHDKVVLLDNNVLASEHGIKEIERISKLNVKVDFNQGLDARLIDNSIARLLSKIKWLKPLRMACDTKSQMPIIEKAVNTLRKYNVTPRNYFIYVLVKDVQDALERVEFLRSLKVDPFAQPFLDYKGTPPTKEQKRFARWVNHKAIFKTVKWEDYV